jgi:hypothetical protein
MSRFRGIYLIASVSVVLAHVVDVNGQPIEVPLSKISSSAAAFHRVTVQSWNEFDTDTDSKSADVSGISQAIATTMPAHLRALCAVSNASASGFGYNSALAGKGDAKTSALCFRYLSIQAAPDVTSANSILEHIAFGEAHWEIPQSQTGNTWIEAEITLVGFPPNLASSQDNFHVHLVCIGSVEINSTDLAYLMFDNGDIVVNGILTDLDGQHQIDEVYTGPSVQLTSREYLAPGVEFRTLTTHESSSEFDQDQPFDLHNTNSDPGDPYVSEVIQWTTKAESKLKAFVNNP